MTAPNLCRPPTINLNATTPGSATEAVSREVLSAWQMRTNYIEYHLRLQDQRPKQGKLFAEEYPEPSTPPALQEPSEPSEEYSFGSSQDDELPTTSGTQATTVVQTIFNVVGLSLHPKVVCLLTPALHLPSPESLTSHAAGKSVYRSGLAVYCICTQAWRMDGLAWAGSKCSMFCNCW